MRIRTIASVVCTSAVFLGCSGGESGDSDDPGREAPVPLDLAATTYHRFDCGDAGPVEFRFLGPDTIEVNVGATRYAMPHQRAASGARYEGDGAEFWNKGDEALLTIGDQRFECRRIGD